MRLETFLRRVLQFTSIMFKLFSKNLHQLPVKGGVEMVLFGMIASVGIRTIGEAKLNLADTRNLTVMGATLCCGIGLGGGIPLQVGGVSINISALFVATVVGVIMNLVLPKSMHALAAAEKDEAEKQEEKK